MEGLSLNISQANISSAYEKVETSNPIQNPLESKDDNVSQNAESSIHNSAVNVSISMESIKVFLNIKSVELSQGNTSAQNSLMNIINNTELYDFLDGKELDGGFSLKSIGYDGKPITELSPAEAKELVSDGGFFGVTETSSRVSSFVIDIAGGNVEALQEARKGIVQGFEQAEQMWGGELPEISYETQKETLKIVDEKIAELLKTDSQKSAENPDTKE